MKREREFCILREIMSLAIKNVNDEEEFRTVLKALQMLNITGYKFDGSFLLTHTTLRFHTIMNTLTHCVGILSVIAGLLHLGNVDFTPTGIDFNGIV